MPAIIVVGAQWGDEGKGKIVDRLAAMADVVVRYGGGANAGHTLVVGDKKIVLHLLPCGALYPDKTIMLGHGTAIDPDILVEEIQTLEKFSKFDRKRIRISDRAQLVLPHHKFIDGLREQGENALGTTKRGIGPTYEDKAGRRGLRIRDLLHPDKLEQVVRDNLKYWSPWLQATNSGSHNSLLAERTIEHYTDFGKVLAPHICDTSLELQAALDKNKLVLLEGAQGTLLDIDHGTYPFVTSSSTIAGGACTGTGIGPTAISEVIGACKAYTTRVGDGPFPTELSGELDEAFRRAGEEFGATTGRPRRCGWLDIVALRHAVRVNGMTQIALTKLDVLSGFPELQVCVAYELDGQRIEQWPCDYLHKVQPIYETLEGWNQDISQCSQWDELPKAAQDYLQRIEQLSGCPIGVVSVGPERTQTIEKLPAF